jgi:D-alanine-D-alanine ligase
VRIAVVHNGLETDAPPDERDVVVQAEAVSSSLCRLGHQAGMEVCTLDLEKIRRKLADSAVDMVFNLVETINGSGRLIALFPALLDSTGLRYTGSTSLPILATSNKVIGKRIISAAGMATPEWIGPFPADAPLIFSQHPKFEPAAETGGLWIIKSLWEHASVGLDERSVVKAPLSEVSRMLPERSEKLGGACFAERYIEGREFNLSLLSGKNGPEVLPAAEISFRDFAAETPKIVDYRAKWDDTSSAWHNTPRKFDVAESDRELVERLEEVALRCWEAFNLRGYARVDFRVDTAGIPWVLEVNTNPCLSPDAGFAAALERAGITFDCAVRRILEDTFKGRN